MTENVCFELPSKFLYGIANGTMKRVGGIIRDASGKIVGHLKEVPVSNGGQQSQILSQLNSLSSGIQLTNALQVVNLGVSLAGFAMLAIKLNKISDQINKIERDVQEVKEITLMNQKIDLFQIISNYQNFEMQLRDFSLAQNKEERKIILSQAYNDMCRNTIVVGNLLQDQESLKSLCMYGMDRIASLYQLFCLSQRSQIAYNILAGEEQVVRARLEEIKENLFSINKNLVSIHRNLGWEGRVLPNNERKSLEQLLDTYIEVENLYESKIIYLDTVKEPLKIEPSGNYQLAFVEAA